mgnify:CR=1 FL=1
MTNAVDLVKPASDGGSYILNIQWLDDSLQPVTPTTATWSLADDDGNEINGRTDVPIPSLATTNSVLLQGNDLLYSDAEFRRIEFTYSYNSATFGTVTQTKEYRFRIRKHANKVEIL